MAFIRLPRFKRSPGIAAMRLTERDQEILQHVHRHRFLRSEHLVALVLGSRQQTLRRLQLLYHHGFLERPRCQIDYYHRSGSRPMVYGLGNKGAGLLKRKLALPIHQLDWPRKNRVQRLFLEHALMVSDFMVALEIECRRRPDIRLLSEDDISPPNGLETRPAPFQWRVNIGSGLKCGVVPDRVFGVEFTDGNRAWFLLEADRASQPSNAPSARTLKIEPDGDPWAGKIKPKIRLKGSWLERAGFKPGAHVNVTCIAPGVLELRSRDQVLMLNESSGAMG